MRKVLKSRLTAGILVLIVVCLGIVLAGDVEVKEGTITGTSFITDANIGVSGDEDLLQLAANLLSVEGSLYPATTGVYDLGDVTAGKWWRRGWFSNGVYVNTLSLFNSSITDSTGAISFGNENLTTTGTIEGGVFKSTGCTATGTKAVAFGDYTGASGDYSTAMGHYTIASADYSTAMGVFTTASGEVSTATGLFTTASGDFSTAMGSWTTASGNYGSTAIGSSVTAGPANCTTAIGKSFTNNVEDSFAVGYNDEDLRVEDDWVKVSGDLDVTQKVTMGTLVLPVKGTTGDPASPDEGQIYVNTADNKVRVYADGAWRDLATW